MTEHDRLPWLDFCRALAIFLVLFGHSKDLLLPYLPWIKYFKFGGFLGVELFFVLSGFLIGAILIKASKESNSLFGWIPAFWGRRWLRTLPNFYFFLAINIVLLIYGIRLDSADSYLPYFFFLQNLAWMHPPFFGEAWSLAVEEIFYLLTPVAIGVFSYLTKNRNLGLLFTIALFFFVSVIAKFIYVEIFNPTFDSGVRKIVLLRLDALMVGVFLAYTTSMKTKVSNRLMQKTGLFLLPLFFVQPIFSLLYDLPFDQSHFARTWLFPITSIGCAGLILVGLYSIQLPKYTKWLSAKIAKLSYSAYLVNLPLLAAINHIFEANPIAGYIKWLIYISMTFLCASITYRLIERPVLLFRERLIPTGRLKIRDLGVVPNP